MTLFYIVCVLSGATPTTPVEVSPVVKG